MFRLGTKHTFGAEHKLPFEEGEESRRHQHEYKLEVVVSGKDLDEMGFLVDIIDLRAGIREVISELEGSFLNELDELEGKTASLENLTKMIWDRLSDTLGNGGPDLYEITVWENEDNWVSFSG